MSINSFTLKNYRSFVDRTAIELRPLTMLFGYNNSGKSALLRALPLIVDSLSGQSPTPLSLKSSALRGSNFTDLPSKITGTQGFDIELLLEDSGIQQLQWTLREQQALRTHFISNFRVFDSNRVGELNTDEYTMTDGLSNNYDVRFGKETYNNILTFTGLLPAFLPAFVNFPIVKVPDKLVSIIKHCQKLKDLSNRVQWLSSVRCLPARNNPFKGAAPKYLESDGNGVADILAYDSIFDELQILPKVSSWYEKNLQQKIVIEEMAEHFQIKLQRLTNSPCKVNIVDVGEGLIQVLPVLVACAMACEGYTLAIEEPESHLHPRLHGALAEHFFDLARQDEPPKVLLETHSENFLLRTQLEIARGKLDPELVMVYWIRQLDDGRSIAEQVTFNKKGRPKGNWPRDVFYTDIDISRQIVQERRKHS